MTITVSSEIRRMFEARRRREAIVVPSSDPPGQSTSEHRATEIDPAPSEYGDIPLPEQSEEKGELAWREWQRRDVRSWTERQEATRAAWAAPSVTQVIDNLTVVP